MLSCSHLCGVYSLLFCASQVVEGQEVAVVEAMKMQNSLRAQRTGKIKKVLVKPGQTLAFEEHIVEFEQE